jgi:hypothetical protein
MNYDLVAYILLFIGGLTVLIPPIIPVANNQKLIAKDFALQVSLPVCLGLISLVIAQVIIMNKVYDEAFFIVAIGLVSATGIAISLAVLALSTIRMRWAAD